MKNNELKRLNRAELVEIIYHLRVANSELEEKLKQTESQLQEKTIIMEESGSIAEAALSINGVFIAAQKAAEQYLLSIKASYTGMDLQVRETEERCRSLIESATAKAEQIRKQSEKDCEERLSMTDKEVERKWTEFQTKVTHYVDECTELRSLLSNSQK